LSYYYGGTARKSRSGLITESDDEPTVMRPDCRIGAVSGPAQRRDWWHAVAVTPARRRGQRGRARRRRRRGPGDHAAVNPGNAWSKGPGYDLARLPEKKLACGPR